MAAVDADTSLKRIELLRVKGSRQVLAYLDKKGQPVKVTEFYQKNNKVTSSTFYYNWVFPLCIKQSIHFNAKNKSTIPEEYTVYFNDLGELAEINPKRTLPKTETDKLSLLSAKYYRMAKKALLNDPLKTFKYDKVIALSINPREHCWEGAESFRKCLDETKVKSEGKVLTQNQISVISKLVKDTASFTGEVAACFEPGMVFIFYNGTEITGVLPICLACNRLESWGFSIPAQDYNPSANPKWGCLSCFGFSDAARKKLVDLCTELKLQNCYDPAQDRKDNKE